MYFYRAYGLTLQSELALPAFIPADLADTTVDIAIRRGKVPRKLETVTKEGVLYQLNPQQFLLHVENVASYLAENGTTIIVDAFSTDESEVRLFLLGSVLGLLLHQRALFPLHASAIGTAKGAVLFAGISGVGKSTTAAALHQRGYPLLADDISVLDFQTTIHVPMGICRVKLWQDMTLALHHAPESAQRVRPNIDKYEIPLEQAELAPVPLHTIYILVPIKQAEITFEMLSGLEKLTVLQQHTYRQQMLIAPDYLRRQVNLFANYLDQIRLVRVKRPQYPVLLEDLLNRLEADFLA